MEDTEKPKLRFIDAQTLAYEGEAYLLLKDPLMLSERNLLVPQPLIPVLALCDGTRTPAGIRASLTLRHGLFLTTERILELLQALDDAFLLDNLRSRAAITRVKEEFRQASFRPPASAGFSYPDNPEELAGYLKQFFQNEDAPYPANGRPNGRIRGLVSPHIDYERGGPVYAQVWGPAAQAAREADLAVIFGTDHFSEGLPFSLTRQSYATPFGVLPTDTSVVDRLARVIGEDLAFAGELHHRREHSIELAAVWLHYMRDANPIPIVPILTGSLEMARQAEDGRLLEQVIAELQAALRGMNVLVIAAGDMAHVGPAFDGPPVSPGDLIQLKAADDELIAAMLQGDAEAFYASIQRVQDANHVCGVSPIYLTLRLLEPLQGESLGYAVCPADVENTSVVTICGVTFHEKSPAPPDHP